MRPCWSLPALSFLLLTMALIKDAKPASSRPQAWRVTLTGLEHLWDADPLPRDEAPSIALSGGVLYAASKHRAFGLDIETGKRLGELPGAKCGSNPYLMGLGDPSAPGASAFAKASAGQAAAASKVLVSPEGQHGRQSFLFYRRTTEGWDQLGGEWKPPHPTTTAYNTQPLVHPVVDGRIFIRGVNGIYCYDLRKKK